MPPSSLKMLPHLCIFCIIIFQIFSHNSSKITQRNIDFAMFQNLVLYFRFVTTNDENLSVCYLFLNSSFTAPRLFPTLPQWVDWECMWILMKIQPSEMTWTVQRDIPYYVLSCSAVKSQGIEKESETFIVMLLVSPTRI